MALSTFMPKLTRQGRSVSQEANKDDIKAS